MNIKDPFQPDDCTDEHPPVIDPRMFLSSQPAALHQLRTVAPALHSPVPVDFRSLGDPGAAVYPEHFRKYGLGDVPSLVSPDDQPEQPLSVKFSAGTRLTPVLDKGPYSR